MKGTILYVGNFELPDKGASANRVVSNGKIFNKLGYRVAFLGVNKQTDFEGVQVFDAEKHMYEEAYPRGNKAWLMHMCSIKNIQIVVDKYDDVCMIILYNVPFVLLKRVKSVFRKTGIKVVYDCTEWTGVTEGSFIKKTVKRLDEYLIRNKIADVADGLIVISKMMEKAYKKCKNMILLPPLIDITDEIWHQPKERESDDFEFCFAGMLDGNKESLDSIVEAFCNFDAANSVLRIIGVTEEEFCRNYPDSKELLKQKKAKIDFMGRLSHKETIKYVSNCDCYIFIRQSDTRNNAGFPTKFAEAFSSGVPIITTDISDIKHYFKGQGTVIDTVSVNEIQKAMAKEVNRTNKCIERKHNKTFHYESYEDVCGEWLEKIYK